MRALTAAEVIRLWELASRYHPVDRALAVLQLLIPDQHRDILAGFSLGQRDQLLLAVRQATFGDRVAGIDHCPQCDETVEFELSCDTLLAQSGEPGAASLDYQGYRVVLRPLNSFDLAAAAAATSLEQARALLQRQCIVEVSLQGEAVASDQLPAGLQDRLNETALAADPQAEILLDLDCPACGHKWHSLLDIVHILWAEISARAQHLLREVHLLASAYGWSEQQILELSPTRRASYLRMVSA
ncbi:MAG: phage baseplate protein [Pseudomonadales bacterium]|nr:phage baseplate protein [Pseudomonadales bacterium]